MTTQRLYVFAIGGELAEHIGKELQRFQETSATYAAAERSQEDLPQATQEAIEVVLEKLISHGYEPPVLYRSEHVDGWSMGDVYLRMLAKIAPQGICHLATDGYEVFSAWIDPSLFSKGPLSTQGNAPEYRWLSARLDEAKHAWEPLAGRRLLVLVRLVLGGLWTDEEVAASLAMIPKWWTES